MQKTSALLLLVCFAAAVQSQIVVGPSAINFGDVQVGQTVQKIAYVINVGDENVLMMGTGGGLEAPFLSVQDCQSEFLTPGETCQMFFNFTPTETGPVTTFSQGTWNNVEYNISITANVVGPQLSIAPTEIDFGTVTVGTTARKIVYVTNVGVAPVLMQGVGGGLVSPFYDVQNCNSNPLPPGDSCEMIITFTPNTTAPASTVASGSWNNQEFNIQVTGNTAEITA